VVRRLSGDEAGCNLDAAAVTGLAGLYRHLRVIKCRWRPARRLGTNTRGMAVFAQVGRGHVIGLFAHRFGAVVAAHAPADDPAVIEVRSEPGGGQVTIAALETRDEVTHILAGGLHTVVTDDAKARDRHRDLGVIDRLRRIPADHRVAGAAVLAGGRMVGPFALRNLAVMAADAAAQHLGMIEVHVRAERDGVMAGPTKIRARDVRRRLRRRVVQRAGDVAGAAVTRRALEHCIDVAGLARQVPVHAIEFKPGGQMIERDRDGRGPCRSRRRRGHNHRERHGERPDPSPISVQFHVHTYWILAPFQE
jgi:hypothetical protein